MENGKGSARGELANDTLVFSFPEVHPEARLRVTFQRTLRIPDDGRAYDLPPGLGSFPLRPVDDYPIQVPPAWRRHGGVMTPMHRAEALWIEFRSDEIKNHGSPYPFAVAAGCGRINAVSGTRWTSLLRRRPSQNYLVVPEQTWLDGFSVDRGVIRQFVAMPLGEGATAEEQIAGSGETGGIQIQVRPMRREVFEKRFPFRYSYPEATPRQGLYVTEAPSKYEMGLAAGGRMRQQIAADPYLLADWERGQRGRCVVHMAAAEEWWRITGANPPETPVTARAYADAGLKWFSWYDESLVPLQGSRRLARLKSVADMARGKHRKLPPGNEPADVEHVVPLSPQPPPWQNDAFQPRRNGPGNRRLDSRGPGPQE